MNQLLVLKSDGIFVIGDLLKARATEPELKDKPILYYPSTGTEYIGYSPSDLYRLSNQAATFYNALIPRRTSSDESSVIVALLGPSNFKYLISLLGLSKLGHTLLLLSPRISEEAHVSLLIASEAKHLLVGHGLEHMGKKVQNDFADLKVHQIGSLSDFMSGSEQLNSSENQLDPAI